LHNSFADTVLNVLNMVNPLECTGSYIATSIDSLWSWCTGRWWVGCYIW